jgi:uncharacterized membrane protein YeaQ/YmgE (transglycosylase-associated protein family)
MLSIARRALQEPDRMDIMGLIVFLLIGALAGWLAGLIVKGGGFGLIGNIAVGVVGAFVAGLLFPRMGFMLGGGLVASVIHSAIGAVIFLFVVSLIRGRR